MLIVTIDGPAGSGKSTVARRVARELRLPFLDTGAMYRAVTFHFMERAVDPGETEKIESLIKSIDLLIGEEGIFLFGKDVSREIRLPEVSQRVSLYASLSPVRTHLVELQRKQAREPGLVTEGRDMGTVVFPEASFKFFLIATPEERARRRFLELQEKEPSSEESYEKVLRNIVQRDSLDVNRKESPLRKASDALEVDTTGMSIDEVVERLLCHISPSRRE